MIPYFVIGYDILKKAGKGILNRQVLDENLCRFRDQLSIQSVPLAEGLKYLGAKSEPDDKHVIHERDPEPELKKHLPAETWLKLVRMDSSRIRTLRIPPLGATLGREPGKAQVILSDSNVSRAHCKFSCAKGKGVA